MVEGIPSKLNFPKDHWTHNTQVEWWYFWGKMSDDRFFHFASFRSEILKGIETRAIHYSLDGKFYEHIYDETFYFPYSGYTYQRFTFETPQFGLILYPKTKPIIHNCTSKGRNYYSIPHLEGEGFLYP